MMRTGWFKFYRQIFDNPICTKDAEHFFVWCYLLAEAQFEEGERVLFQNEEIVLEKGQLLRTITQISNDLHIKEMKVYRILKLLENEKQIVKRTSNKNTLITVLNWEKYQSCEKQNEEPMKNGCKTDVKQMKDECKTDVKPSYYNKEIKNDKNEKNDKKVRKEPVVYYPNDELLNNAFKEFVTMRNKIKKPLATKQALTRMMNKIEKLSGGDNDLAIKILNQSTDHCWQDVYELKSDGVGNRTGNSGIDWDNV